jgi:hypothetical protein
MSEFVAPFPADVNLIDTGRTPLQSRDQFHMSNTSMDGSALLQLLH